MRYLEIIPILLFCLMLVMDRKHLSNLRQSLRDFEKRNLSARSTPYYLSPETIYALKYYDDLAADEGKVLGCPRSQYNNELEFSEEFVLTSSHFQC